MKELHHILKELLRGRGISSEEDLEEYLSPKPQRTYDPFLMKGMDEAVEKIITAASEKKKICIYGDYDCDGVTSVTLLLYAFSRFMDKEDISYYIPERARDGYGLNRRAIEEVKGSGADLLVTVDCGCSSHDDIEYAKSIGLDVIVTDHHIVPDKIPECVMLDPKQEGCGYPFKGLAGCGVAYKLVQALQRTVGFDRKVLADSLDIVGIATIGDIVPLTDENRTLAKYGIDRIRRTERPGLLVLMDEISLGRDKISSTGVAFGIVPNINANGRMAKADIGVKLLSSKTKEEAKAFARKTAENNGLRKRLQDDAFTECLDLAELQCPGSVMPVILANVHEGVAGIVAGKIKDVLGRPAVIVTENGDKLKGTGRSIDGVDIHGILSGCAELFEKFGGHQGACGFTMPKEYLGKLREGAERGMEKLLEKDPALLDGTVKYDMEITAADADIELAEEIQMMEPFGKDNERPVFRIRNVIPDNGRIIGNGTHIRFDIHSDGKVIGCVCFGKAEEYSDMIFGSRTVDVTGTLDINKWNGYRNLQMNVRHMAESKR